MHLNFDCSLMRQGLPHATNVIKRVFAPSPFPCHPPINIIGLFLELAILNIPACRGFFFFTAAPINSNKSSSAAQSSDPF